MFKSGDWVVCQGADGCWRVQQVINYLETEKLYIVTGNPHTTHTESELRKPPNLKELRHGDMILW